MKTLQWQLYRQFQVATETLTYKSSKYKLLYTKTPYQPTDLDLQIVSIKFC